MRLSALATTASSRGRGFHPSIRWAFALVAERVLSSSGTIERSVGLNRAAARISQLGNSRVGTFFAASPSLALSTLLPMNPNNTR